MIYLVLKHEGPLSRQALAEKTMLSDPTLRKYIQELERTDHITSWTHPEDGRQRIFSVDRRT